VGRATYPVNEEKEQRWTSISDDSQKGLFHRGLFEGTTGGVLKLLLEREENDAIFLTIYEGRGIH